MKAFIRFIFIFITPITHRAHTAAVTHRRRHPPSPRTPRLPVRAISIFLLAAAFAIANPTGGRFVFASFTPVDSTDPTLASTPAARCAVSQAYEGLMRFLPEKAELKLGLASRYSIGDNSRIYTFWLRPGVRFADGSLLRPEDVVFSLRRNHRLRWLIDDVFKVGDDSVQVSLKRPFAPFLRYLAMPDTSIVSASAAASGRLVGTGAFSMFSSNQSRTEMVANESHWRGSPKAAELVFLHVPNDTERLNMLKHGSIHVASFRQLSEANKRKYPGLQAAGFNTLTMMFNTKNSVFAHAILRRAVMMAIDKNALIDSSTTVAEGVFPPGALGYDAAIKGVEYNPQEAKEIFKKNGVIKEFSISLALFTDGPVRSSWARPVAIKIAEFLQDLGIYAQIHEIKWSDYVAGNARADLMLMMLDSKHADSDDFMQMLQRFVPAVSENEQIKKLAKVGRYSPDLKEREQYYFAAWDLLSEASLILPLVHEHLYFAMQPGTSGLRINPLGVCDFIDVKGSKAI